MWYGKVANAGFVPCKIEKLSGWHGNKSPFEVYAKILNKFDFPSFNLLQVAGTDVFEADFPVPQGGVNIGDSFLYKITAVDSAIVENSVSVPLNGFYNFTIEDFLIFTTNFDADNGSFSGTNHGQW